MRKSGFFLEKRAASDALAMSTSEAKMVPLEQ
jgi:hypothetical protein